MNKNEQSMSIPIGISLLLVVFVLMAMVTFGTLSFVTARTDANFSESTAEATRQYYAADIVAKQTLQSIDEKLKAIEAEDNTAYFDEIEMQLAEYDITFEDENLLLRFDTTVNDAETLKSCIAVKFGDAVRYEILEWRLVYTEDWSADEGVDVFVP